MNISRAPIVEALEKAEFMLAERGNEVCRLRHALRKIANHGADLGGTWAAVMAQETITDIHAKN